MLQNGKLAEMFPTAVEAVKTGKVELTAQLLKEYPDLVKGRWQDRTLLQHLCDWPGHFPHEIETARLLIAAGADVNVRFGDSEDNGETPLQWAASSDDAAMAEFLIDAGASVDGLNDDRRPLAQAILYECHEVAKVLVKRGATIDLEFAAGLGRMDLLPSFFDHEGNLLPNAGSHTPPFNQPAGPVETPSELLVQALVYAVIGDKLEACKFLLDRGANVNTFAPRFGDYGSPFHWAIQLERTKIVELFVQRGADLSEVNPKRGLSALGFAERIRNEETRKQIMELLK